MKNIQKYQARIILLLLGFFFLNTSIYAQIDYDKYLRTVKLTEREMLKLNKKEFAQYAYEGMSESVKRADYVAAVKVHGSVGDSLICFYADNGRIFTAKKVTLLQDFKGNFRSKKGEAVVIFRGGIIGDDEQGFGAHADGFIRRGPQGGAQILLEGFELPFANNSPFDDLPAYFIGDMSFSYRFPFLNVKGVLFETKESFDDFVYKALGKKNPRKKKGVGLDKSFGPNTFTMSPLTVRAGLEEILTIEGIDLPDDKAKMEVLFINADMPYDNLGVLNFISVLEKTTSKEIDLSQYKTGTHYLVWRNGGKILDSQQVQIIKK